MKPEPWALVQIGNHYNGQVLIYASERLLSWEEGQVDLKPSIVAGLITGELSASNVPTDRSSESLFAAESGADLQLGVRVFEMAARFCQYCDRPIMATSNWRGAVRTKARWEVYSALDRKVVAAVDIESGYESPKQGLQGEPERLVYEAIRDSVRRLVATTEFRQAVAAGPKSSAWAVPNATPQSALTFTTNSRQRPVAEASASVAVVYASDGSGSGFLISGDGYVLTNRHVVGASKFVKLKWSDGSE